MEGLRERPTSQIDAPLPPPPAPFPVDLLPTAEAGPSSPTRATITATHDLTSVQASCVAALSALLPPDSPTRRPIALAPADQHLAAALTEFLEATYELDELSPSPAYEEAAPRSGAATPSAPASADVDASFEALTEHLQRVAEQPGTAPAVDGTAARLHPAISVVRGELAWARVQSLSRVVLEVVHEREVGDTVPERPPVYDETPLPTYPEKDAAESSTSTTKPRTVSPEPHTSEQMLRELDELTDAIHRLSSLAPKFNEQRSVLRPRDPAVKTQTPSPRSKVTDKQKMAELEDIWRKIERAHGKRRMRDQDVDADALGVRRSEQREQFLQELYDRASASRMRNQDGEFGVVNVEMAKARELRERDRFLRELIENSAGSRLSNQDAEAPDEEARQRQHQTFIANLIARSEERRLSSQDYPMTVEERLEARRLHLIESLVSFSSSGRLADQDSLPPAPRKVEAGHPAELVSVGDFIKTSPPLPQEEADGKAKENGDKHEKGGTMRKIRGLVRRGSIGLGLKVGPSYDIASANFVAEHQENLNAVQITVHGVGLPLNGDVTLATLDPAGCSLPAVEASVAFGGTTLRIPLPGMVYSHQTAQLKANGPHLEGKLTAVPTQPSSTNTLTTRYPLSASELRDLAPRALCCTSCDRIVANLKPPAPVDAAAPVRTNWKDLPSEHWAEMIEVWMCHQDPSWTSQLAQHTREGFWPVPGGLLVGGSYLLVHPQDARRASMSFSPGKDDAWSVVSCLCGEPLGKARKDDKRPGAGTVRFSKWAVALLREDDEEENVEPIRYPLGTFVAADMLELAQAHATYRFIVRDEDSGDKRILIWLFNPSVRMTYRSAPALSPSPLPSPLRQTFASEPEKKPTSRRSSSASSGSGPAKHAIPGVRSVRTCKVMYKLLAQNEEVRPDGFGPGGQVEDLRYPAVVVKRLAAVLTESSAVWPRERREMGIWKVGFLERV